MTTEYYMLVGATIYMFMITVENTRLKHQIKKLRKILPTDGDL